MSAINEIGIKETPRIEYIFTDLHELGTKLFIKLTFSHIYTVDKLSKAELKIKDQPVLVLEPSIKQDLEKSLQHAIPHHQVVVYGAGAEEESFVRRVMEGFGSVAKLHYVKNYFVVTYTQLRSAKNALRNLTYNDCLLYTSPSPRDS